MSFLRHEQLPWVEKGWAGAHLAPAPTLGRCVRLSLGKLLSSSACVCFAGRRVHPSFSRWWQEQKRNGSCNGLLRFGTFKQAGRNAVAETNNDFRTTIDPVRVMARTRRSFQARRVDGHPETDLKVHRSHSAPARVRMEARSYVVQDWSSLMRTA